MIGAIAQYSLVNGDLSVTSTSNVYTNDAIALYTTNPCEVTATATATDFYLVTETSAVVYTSTYEVTYVETITVSIPDPSTSRSSTTSTPFSSSSAIPLTLPVVQLPLLSFILWLMLHRPCPSFQSQTRPQA
jgi:hypothetical protein